jgi:hypothetical protein
MDGDLMANNDCGARATTEDDRELVCALPVGHDGPVHETSDGEQWGGDMTLPAPHHRDPDA